MKKFLCAIALCLFSLTANSHDLTNVVSEAIPSVVYIEVTPHPELSEPNVDVRAKKYWLRNPSVIATGFVIEKNLIVTNYHVIEDVVRKSANISVYFYETNNKKYTAKLVGYDEVVDIALLKIEGVHPSACLCAVEELRIGQEVFSISHFLGIEFSVTSGMISSVHRSDPRFPYIHYVQLQLVQGNGSSGGPVFNAAGKVVSINQSIISMVPITESTNTGRMLSSVAFSIRADVVNESISRIKKEGKVQRADLGVLLEEFNVNSSLYEFIDKRDVRGTIVLDTDPLSKTSLLVGDVILTLNGRKFTDPEKLFEYLDRNTEIGDYVKVQVYRKSSIININIPVIAARR